MKVFISWSGERSLAVAEALKDWLPKVIQVVKLWVSTTGIEKGSRWGAEIASQLEECRVGIICLTPENLFAPWLLFEAGALAKTLEKTFVCPYLLDLQSADIRDPLAQFQPTRAEKEDTRKLLHTINRAAALVASEQPLSEPQLDTTFEKWWSDLETALQRIPPAQSSKPQQRPERELLEDILEGVRGISRVLSGGRQGTLWERDVGLSSSVVQHLLTADEAMLIEALRAGSESGPSVLRKIQQLGEQEFMRLFAQQKRVEGKDADP